MPIREPGQYTKVKRELKKKAGVFPILNEPAFKQLKQYKYLFSTSPLAWSHHPDKISHARLHARCEKALDHYENHLFSEKNMKTIDRFSPREGVYVRKLIKELKKDHDLAHEVIKGIHAETPFQDGTILNSESRNLTINIPTGRRIGEVKTTTIINPHFESKHHFAVIKGEVISLVKFPNL